MKGHRILVVDDDPDFRDLVAEILAGDGFLVNRAGDAEEALTILSREPIDLVLTDQRMPGLDGLELTRRVRASSDAPKVIVMTAHGTIPQAVEAVRVGASDYITKPLQSPAALRRLVRGVLGRRIAESDVNSGDFLTRDPETLKTLTLADRAAATDANILITGPSGTGKELLARRIHANSPRAAGPFVAVNSAAIPDNLAESELFGHEKGAFTGADRSRSGRFEQAARGTLFLDEIGELPEAIQAKLLRTLEERTVERVGGTQPVPIDIRLVAATNRDLESEVAAGRFRSDLYYRLNVVRLHLNPLRDRTGDLAILIPILLEQLASELDIGPASISADAMARLGSHTWPGNIRELRNALERALIAGGNRGIDACDLPAFAGDAVSTSDDAAAPMSLAERERQAILEALESSSGHREHAARLLGISVRTLYNRLKQYDIR